MNKPLTEQEQLDIIKEVEEKYSKFLDPNFDASVFLKCRDNFALTSHIESVKIFEMDNPPSNPTFTIAIPTYNRCETLKEAIDSALAQETDEHYEVIVVENVDDFDTKTEAQEMLEREYSMGGGVTYYRNKENLGMFGNWNRCLTLAKGQWVCILHSDDMITPNYIEEMRKNIVKNKKYQDTTLVGVRGDFIFFNKTRRIREKILYFLGGGTKLFDNLHSQGYSKLIPPNAALHNRTQCIKLGGYNQDEYPMADTLFFVRVFAYGKILIYNKELQYKTDEISEFFNPKTLLHYCFIGPSFILGNYKPTIYARYLAYNYLKHFQNYRFKQYPILANYVKLMSQDKRLLSKMPRGFYRFCRLYEFFVKGHLLKKQERKKYKI